MTWGGIRMDKWEELKGEKSFRFSVGISDWRLTKEKQMLIQRVLLKQI